MTLLLRIAFSLTVLVLLSCQSSREPGLLRRYQAAYDQGRYKEALSPAIDLLAIAERSKNPNARIEALERAGELELKGKNRDRARELYERALREAESQSPTASGRIAGALIGLAETQLLAEDFGGAQTLLQRSIELCEGSGDARITRALTALARAYSAQERDPQAVDLLKRALEIAEQRFGKDSLEVVEPLRELAKIDRVQKRYPEAVELLERAVDIDDRSRPPAHPSLISSLETLASVYQDQPFYQERTEAIRKDLVARTEAAYGPEAEDTLVQRYELVNLQSSDGDFQRSQRDMEALLARFERTLGLESERTIQLLTNLCRVEFNARLYEKAETVCLQATRSVRSDPAWKPRSWRERRHVGAAFRLLGELYENADRYTEAEAAFEAARALLDVPWPARDATMGRRILGETLSSCGRFYRRQRNLDKAVSLLSESLEVLKQAVGDSSYEVGLALAYLGDAERERGNYDRAVAWYSRSLKVLEPILGPDHGTVASILEGIADTCNEPCEAGDRLELAQRALQLMQKAYGAGDVNTADGLTTLARVRSDRGDHAGAVTAMREAVTIREKAGPFRPGTTSALRDLGWQEARAGALDEALRTFERMEEAEEQQLRIFLGSVSESRQRAFLEGARISLDDLVVFQQRWMPQDERAQRLVLRALLRRKARALEVTAAQFAAVQNASGETGESLRSLGQVRGELAELLLGESAGTSAARIAELRSEQERLEAIVAAQLGEAAPRAVSVESVGAALPSKAALLELVRYIPPDDIKRARYAAYVLKNGGRTIRSLDLGEARAMDQQIASLRTTLAVPGANAFAPARRLDRALLEPLEKIFTDVEHIYVAADGAFLLLPIAALRDRRGRFRLERWEISSLDSGRDLLRPPRAPRAGDGTAALVLGGALFDHRSEEGVPPAQLAQGSPRPLGRNLRARDFGARQFGPLPSTRVEAGEVAAALGVHPAVGVDASEAKLKSSRSPIVLHVATHAFFLGDPPSTAPQMSSPREQAPSQSGAEEAPMLRSGLALTGANLRSDDGEDGILTALEATTLHLAETELVTLSACDTGVGKIDHGEGVLGLRRAFALAGARSLLLSLWSVNDEATGHFMTAYYRRLVRGEGRSAALRSVQREFLADPLLRDPYYWAPFVLSGDPGAIPQLRATAPLSAAPSPQLSLSGARPE